MVTHYSESESGGRYVKGELRIEGQVKLAEADSETAELELTAYVYNRVGEFLGSAAVDKSGAFNIAPRLAQPADVELVIAPKGNPAQVRASSGYIKKFAAKDWQQDGGVFLIRPDLNIRRDIWWPWWPQRICISGHVRKISHHDGHTDICPVPFVKVEIFDVDRESCLWPWIRNGWDKLIDRPVIRLPELIRQSPIPPRPIPGPDPAPELNFGGSVSLNPQPLPPRARAMSLMHAGEAVGFDPQPAPPAASLSMGRVGEIAALQPSLASRLDRLTITSKLAPWLLFPHCFYSTQLVCETTTDCHGYFRCCFKWWPFHFRRGRLRFDARPDIIIRVTQVINGVAHVIYLDPYTSTRWNISNAHIDLFLDNEEIICGTPDCDPRPAGSPVFFTRIGDDEVYLINQGSGLYRQPGPPSNVAYGSTLLVYGQFGDALSTGAPARYYRLSYAAHGSSNFVPITAALSDTRVNKGTLLSDSHVLGPQTVNGVQALYAVRNFSDYYWYNPDWIGTWNTLLAEVDTGKYVLRLEVFDENGNKLTSAMGVDYRDGTVVPPAVLPPMLDRCDLVITLDNKPPVVNIDIPAVLNECGVIPGSSVPPLNLNISVSQENGRLHAWGLQYTKGVNPAVHVLDSGSSNTGLPSAINKVVDATNAPTGIDMLDGVTTTCAFALKLWATAHVRDGRQFIYYQEQIKAIAIENCIC
ncbi:MAG: hypothetical protein HY272_07490 [Gammaproteobacteria bacterium]|nr:hypothetical protein [Gammaproteobacteria bacterium]